jgi:hypothetical protein
MKMQNKALSKSFMSFGKYIVWFGISAAIEWLTVNLTSLSIPAAIRPLIIVTLAAVLKSAATYWQTKKDEYCGGVK